MIVICNKKNTFSGGSRIGRELLKAVDRVEVLVSNLRKPNNTVRMSDILSHAINTAKKVKKNKHITRCSKINAIDTIIKNVSKAKPMNKVEEHTKRAVIRDLEDIQDCL
tara:strand:- start:197 stop:523 length:327 start_codon:yes stop_codon:yes gene_type:complete